MNQIDELRQLLTVRDFIRYGVSSMRKAGVFFGHGSDNALDEATNLVLHALNMPHDMPGHFMDSALIDDEKEVIRGYFQRRIQERIPAAYITNEAWFAGHSFYVDENVLVPRSPIGELIEHHFEPWLERDNVYSILDMCTGSGCIAIACAHAFPETSVDAVDISDAAIAIANRNVKEHGLPEQVSVIKSDLFKNLSGRTYDLIVSNPPYVDLAEMNALPEEFRREPELGLASGNDGLDATRVILREAADHLNDNGILIVEVGASDEALERAFPEVPFTWIEFERGGSGVFVLSKAQLQDYAECFNS